MSITTYDHIEGQAEDTAQKEARFSFGENWARFLDVLNEDRIASAEKSLCRMLGLPNLSGKRFLDVGSGSGLFSLAAHRLGARVHSFDLDPQSVACTKELRRRYAVNAADWRIEQHSALDADYLSSLGSFDIVYSWGVLHHTGAMWRALDLVHRPVVEGGLLFVAIYNDTGTQSARWLRIKRLYNRLPRPLRIPYAVAVATPGEIKEALRSLVTGNAGHYLRTWGSSGYRGMSRWHDTLDWIGGYPYEVAKPEEIFDFYTERHFILRRMKCGGVGLGCNEFVFEKTGTARRHGIPAGE
ncbi:class I SAM-dependent methyltransferase [Nitrospira moscoviensis]|uniref:Methyltransferase type 12 n=1 Tax=Nitrospira moscoviensis TaxID=42253 RepID=A0A0K2GJ32_NITMO|nr:class I SAM-dependent methyltransferase [Nitrospira moscoviensis]ALA60941.1 Methyltransferase type 12 [Nitrospira moscoviensis]